MWFTPLKSKDAWSMRLKALSIADVVAANKDIGYEWIEQMMVNVSVPNHCRFSHSSRLVFYPLRDSDIPFTTADLFSVLFSQLIDTDEVNENVELACQQVVNCLVDHLIQIEQENQAKDRSSERRSEQERVERDMENVGDDDQEMKASINSKSYEYKKLSFTYCTRATQLLFCKCFKFIITHFKK